MSLAPTLSLAELAGMVTLHLSYTSSNLRGTSQLWHFVTARWVQTYQCTVLGYLEAPGNRLSP